MGRRGLRREGKRKCGKGGGYFVCYFIGRYLLMFGVGLEKFSRDGF